MSKDVLGVSTREARGAVADLLEKLGGNNGIQWLSAAKRFFRKKNPWLADPFFRDMTKEGWKLLEDVSEPIISIADMELVTILKDGEARVSCDVMRKRAKNEKAMLGQRHAEYLLQHQNEIPTEFRKLYLIFPGTVWRDSSGHRNVPYLYWSGWHWCLIFRWLGFGWHSSGRLLRPRPQYKSVARRGAGK